MQQDNNIKNKLQQLENQRLPNLSHMDEHWQQMQGMLATPVNAPAVKPAILKFLPWIIGVFCVTMVTVLIINRTTGKKINNTVSNVPIQLSRDLTPVINGISASKILTTKKEISKQPQVIVSSNRIKKFVNRDKDISGVERKSIATTVDNIKVKDTITNITTKEIGANRQQMLQDLFNQISKQEEKFVINKKKDTLLSCAGGTDLFIPAFAFNAGDSITIKVKEFYKYSDMIANRLTTMSGSQQLISGGMMHLSAEKNGEEVELNAGSTITVYTPGISASDSMQIFYGEREKSSPTIASAKSPGNVNWRLTTIPVDSPVIKMFIRAIDLRDDYEYDRAFYRGNKVKGIFLMAKNSAFTKEQLKVMLQKKYPNYYDKIILKKLFSYNIFLDARDAAPEEDDEYGDIYNPSGVGDTAVLLPRTIKFYKLQPIDTVYKIVNWLHNGTRRVQLPPALTSSDMKKISDKYSIRLDKMGWINCDKFKINKSSTDYVVDLKDTAYNYCTMMVFDRYKSIMGSTTQGSTTVVFSNVPAGEKVKVISIGINKNGQSVIAIKDDIIKYDELVNLQFETTSATEINLH